VANDFYNEAFTGVAGQTARAAQVENQLAAISAAFDLVQAILYAGLRGPSTETLNQLPNAAGRAGKYLRFADPSGQPEVVASPFTYRSDWENSTIYVVGDVVRAGPYNSLYICRINHTSLASPAVFAVGPEWDIMIDLSGLNFVSHQIVTTNQNAIAGSDYLVDSSGGTVTITLPASPSPLEAPINITHIGGTLGVGQQIIVARNGNRIMGVLDDLLFDRANQSISLIYSDAARGWRLRVLT